jgi:hypothetical protein
MAANRVAPRWMPTPGKIVHDNLQPTKAQAIHPFHADALSEAIGPATFELRKASSRAEVQDILSGVPVHLHGALAEGAAGRNIVAAPIVIFLLQEIGKARLIDQLGRVHAQTLIARYLDTPHSDGRAEAEAHWAGATFKLLGPVRRKGQTANRYRDASVPID